MRATTSAATAARRLLARPGARDAAALATRAGFLFAVGGAVRDAFLGRPRGDLDLLVVGDGGAVAGELARRLGTRVVELGTPPERLRRVRDPAGATIDVWEAADLDADLRRRDFTVNALAIDLANGKLAAPERALEDLRRGVLALPRPGVLLEDPLRVVRAARLGAEIPSLRVSAATRGELLAAAPLLDGVPGERIRGELDRLLSTPRPRVRRALRALESWGALAPILPGTNAAERRRGTALAARDASGSPAVRRALLLLPLDGVRARAVLERLRAPALEKDLAAALRRHPPPRRFRRRRDVTSWLRAAGPFAREVTAVHRARDGDTPFLRAARAVASNDTRLARVLAPTRPLGARDVAEALGLEPGAALGRALRALDEAVAAGEVRSVTGARRMLERLR